MFVAIVRADLHLPHAASLKDKRAILNRLKERLRAQGAAVSEVEHADLWQRAALGMAVVSGAYAPIEEQVHGLRAILDREDRIVLLDWQIQHYGGPG